MASEKKSEPQPQLLLGLDVPTQRWYALSLGALLQALKLADFALPPLLSAVSTGIFSSPTHYFWKWITVDAAYVFGLRKLGLPKLMFAWQASVLQFLTLLFLNYLLFGPWTAASIATLPGLRDWYRDFETTIQGYTVRVQQVIQSNSHLQGQLTVVLSPINTVHLNPYGESFCLSSPSSFVIVPVIFNNTLPKTIHYKHTALGGGKSKTYDIPVRNLEIYPSSSVRDEDEDDIKPDGLSRSPYALEDTQILRGLKVSKTGSISIETAGESRVRSGEVTIVECPHAEFIRPEEGELVRCQGDTDELRLKVRGMPPLFLEYSWQAHGDRERFQIESIDGERNADHLILEITVPFTAKFSQHGQQMYTLQAVQDAIGNAKQLNDSLSLNVLKRATYSFRDCQPGQPAILLIGPSQSAQLRLSSKEGDIKDSPWTVTLSRTEDGHIESATTESGRRELIYQARSPGNYEISSVRGKYCDGIVLSPASCRVIEQPLPQANISWTMIHECTGDTGVAASLMLYGRPPFQVSYSMKRDNQKPRIVHKPFSGARGEIILQPEESGHYEYQFLTISDSYYKHVAIQGAERIEQTVRPLAFAHFVRASGGNRGGIQVNTCEGSTVDIEIELKGTPPFSIEVQIVGKTGSQTVVVDKLVKSTETLTLPIPKEIHLDGGTFQIDLVSVQDTQGCKRTLTVPGVSVNVRRVKPTARFYRVNEDRVVTILDGEHAQLPLRLTGEGPWSLSYSHSESSSVVTAKVDSANGVLKVAKPGLYTIREIRDAHCPGAIIPGESDFQVDITPRPSIVVASSETVTYQGGTLYSKKEVCQGDKDSVELELSGTPPFRIRYSVAHVPRRMESTELQTTTFSSIQMRTRLELDTSTAGAIMYSIDQLGDASYPLLPGELGIPVLQLSQPVLGRPRAGFKSSKPLSYCLHDRFTPQDNRVSQAGVITLDGQPPFFLEFSLQNFASGEVRKERVQILHREWTVAIPDYKFSTVGRYSISIDRVIDASHCDQTVEASLPRSIQIDVFEVASVLPFERREDYCVGERLRFQLEGVPPWEVSYVVNEHRRTEITSSPLFQRLADVPGTFGVTSLAQQSSLCKTTVSDINYRIHDIPSAKVSHGERRVEAITEGEQAEILFTLIGEPPFTFTYQRTELVQGKRKKDLKVLETHTVSGVTSTDYSIFSSQEGTWTVTFISDKFCKFPVSPSSTEATNEVQ